MKSKDFAVFILTHGRADNIITLDSLKKAGYTGPLYYVIDTDDKQQDRYKELFGDKVIMFNKRDIAKTFDNGDNFGSLKNVTYARNACFDIAEKLGYKWFLVLDDDYTQFQYRFDGNLEFRYKPIERLDDVIEAMLDYFKSIPAKSICMAQGGDYMGGAEGSMGTLRMKRKAMNTFFLSTERRFQFVGRINEDVNAYVKHGSTGDLFLTVPNISVVQVATQQNPGGLTDIYLDAGTYVKSFYTILYHPSSVSIRLMGMSEKRLHHSIRWVNTVPKIISEIHKR